MVTTATWHASQWALDQIKKDLPNVCVTDFIIETIMSGDKQSAASMLVLPRGVHVQAEAWIPESVLQSTLKVLIHTSLVLIHTSLVCTYVVVREARYTLQWNLQ